MRQVGVFADAPLPDRCLLALRAAHAPEWVAGLYAAMLRDTLDGLLSVEAERYVVFARAEDHVALERHVPAPWQLETERDAVQALRSLGAERGTAVLARSDAPTTPIEPLIDALDALDALDAPVVLGPTPTGEAWVLALTQTMSTLAGDVPWSSAELAATIRVRCMRASRPLVTLPTCPIVVRPSAVIDLLDELRRHPERAPRTAHYVVTHG